MDYLSYACPFSFSQMEMSSIKTACGSRIILIEAFALIILLEVLLLIVLVLLVSILYIVIDHMYFIP